MTSLQQGSLLIFLPPWFDDVSAKQKLNDVWAPALFQTSVLAIQKYLYYTGVRDSQNLLHSLCETAESFVSHLCVW
jgi:hypothetical protein